MQRLGSVLPVALLLLALLSGPGACFSAARLRDLRDESRALFYHGYRAYMDHAYPADELRPVSCSPRYRDFDNENNFGTNDMCGNFSMTLIDTLDTLAILGDCREFERSVQRVIASVDVVQDARVQIFEVNIRVLGGLLSAHQYAERQGSVCRLPWYRGELLAKARVLADSMLPAFQTASGLPYARINLKRGIIKGENTENCAAGAGSFLLEFGLLSQLTGDPKYEAAARKAFFAVWRRRSNLNLLGNTFDLQRGLWTSAITGIGAGVDSFFEYALKAAVLFGDEEYQDVWDTSLSAFVTYLQDEHEMLYRNVHLISGVIVADWIDSLSAYFPGLLVLAGETDLAMKNHFVFQSLWQRYGAIPERFNLQTKSVEFQGYPLRPEFIESTYFLYRATKDPFYLSVAEQVLESLKAYTMTECGYAALSSVETKEKEDRMESFVLSECFKYLFLTFDENHELNHLDSNFVFTTEAHPLHALSNTTKRVTTAADFESGTLRNRSPVCAAPPNLGANGLTASFAMSTKEFGLAQLFVGVEEPLVTVDEGGIFPPTLKAQTCPIDELREDIDVSLAVGTGQEFSSPIDQVFQQGSIIVIHAIRNLRLRFSKSINDNDYVISIAGKTPILPTDMVVITDPAIATYENNDMLSFVMSDLRLYLHCNDTDASGLPLYVDAYMQVPQVKLPDGLMQLEYMADTNNTWGCEAYFPKPSAAQVVVVDRGHCSFAEKIYQAQSAGLVVVLDTDDKAPVVFPRILGAEMHERFDGKPSTPLVYVQAKDRETMKHWHGKAVGIKGERRDFGSAYVRSRLVRNLAVQV